MALFTGHYKYNLPDSRSPSLCRVNANETLFISLANGKGKLEEMPQLVTYKSHKTYLG